MSDYPSEEVLESIRTWNGDMEGCFEIMRENWWSSSLLFTRRGRIIKMSTGGWSGNEDLIDALHKATNVVWMLCWVSSTRGGHYVFEIPKGENNP
jgi:hypothetical protein